LFGRAQRGRAQAILVLQPGLSKEGPQLIQQTKAVRGVVSLEKQAGDFRKRKLNLFQLVWTVVDEDHVLRPDVPAPEDCSDRARLALPADVPGKELLRFH